MKRIIQTIAIASILGAQAGLTGAFAQEQTNQNVDVKALLQRIDQLEQKVNALESKESSNPPAAAPSDDKQRIDQIDQSVKVLDRKRELAEEAAAEKAKTAPVLTVDQNGLSARSADTNFVVQLHGLIQVDNRSFFNDGGIQGNDSFLLRRARPILSGTLYRDFDFMFVPDFGGSTVQIFDAYLNYRYQPWLQLKAGKFKSPVGLEYLQSDTYTYFNERSLVTDLVPGRDVGFQLWGDIDGGVLSYAAGIFNGVGDARNSANSDFDDNREYAGRLFAQPFKQSGPAALRGLGLGVGGSFGHAGVNGTASTAGLTSGYLTDGQQTFFAYNPAAGTVIADGDHWRLSPQAYYYYGPLGVMAEYAVHNQRVRNTTGGAVGHLEHQAWQVTGSWVLTGEDATFTGVTPRHNFDLRNGGWGALQLVGRYEELDVDNKAFPTFATAATSASGAQAWSAGLNWYLNRNLTFKTSYSHTTFEANPGSSLTGAVTRQPEEVFFTRLQLAF